MFISSGSEQYKTIYCKTRDAREASTSKARHPYEKQSGKDCENSL